ncbi:MAG: hypothetical protein JWN70_2257 [Planctomycetaceae bacterium]|nr:hypothetical protein [Planctomycetaceae bacterium]
MNRICLAIVMVAIAAWSVSIAAQDSGAALPTAAKTDETAKPSASTPQPPARTNRFDRGGFGGGDVTPPLPSKAIPAKDYVSSKNLVIAVPEEGDRLLGYSRQLEKWTTLKLDATYHLLNPVFSDDVGYISNSVQQGDKDQNHYIWAYSATTGLWDTLVLPVGSKAFKTIQGDRVVVEDDEYIRIFSNRTGKWAAPPQPDDPATPTGNGDSRGATASELINDSPIAPVEHNVPAVEEVLKKTGRIKIRFGDHQLSIPVVSDVEPAHTAAIIVAQCKNWPDTKLHLGKKALLIFATPVAARAIVHRVVSTQFPDATIVPFLGRSQKNVQIKCPDGLPATPLEPDFGLIKQALEQSNAITILMGYYNINFWLTDKSPRPRLAQVMARLPKTNPAIEFYDARTFVMIAAPRESIQSVVGALMNASLNNVPEEEASATAKDNDGLVPLSVFKSTDELAGKSQLEERTPGAKVQPSTAQLKEQYEAQERQAADIAKQHRSAPNASLKSKLQQIVTEAFALRQQLHQAELSEFHQRMAKVQQTIQTRETLRDKIIKRRVEDLLNPDWGWDKKSDSKLDIQVPPSTNHGRNRNKATRRVVLGVTLPKGAAITRIESGKIIVVDNSSTKVQDSDPIALELVHDRNHQFRLTNLPGLAQPQHLFIEFPNPVAAQANSDAGYYLPVQITEEDLKRIPTGNSVVKVIYRPNLPPGVPLNPALKFATLVNTQLAAEIDPIARAAELGTILAIVRLREHAAQPALPIPTTPDSPTELEGDWRLESSSFQGKVSYNQEAQLWVRNRQWIVVRNDSDERCPMDINSTVSPKQLDLVHEPANGVNPAPSKMIYRLDGDLLTVKGLGALTRPTAFNDDDRVIQTWKRTRHDHDLISLQINSPKGAAITFHTQNGPIQNATLRQLPLHAAYATGTTQQLQLSNIPYQTGARPFVTIMFPTLAASVRDYALLNRIPLQITDEEITRAHAGKPVAKVLYLPDPDPSTPTSSGAQVINDSQVDSKLDFVEEAHKLGDVLAIVRMSNIRMQSGGLLPQSAEIRPYAPLPGASDFVPAGSVTKALENATVEISLATSQSAKIGDIWEVSRRAYSASGQETTSHRFARVEFIDVQNTVARGRIVESARIHNGHDFMYESVKAGDIVLHLRPPIPTAPTPNVSTTETKPGEPKSDLRLILKGVQEFQQQFTDLERLLKANRQLVDMAREALKAGTGTQTNIDVHQLKVDECQKSLQLLRAEYDSQISLLSLEARYKKGKSDLAQLEYQKILQANLALPGTIPDLEVRKFKTAWEEASLRFEQANTVLELYRKVEPAANTIDQQTDPGGKEISPKPDGIKSQSKDRKLSLNGGEALRKTPAHLALAGVAGEKPHRLTTEIRISSRAHMDSRNTTSGSIASSCGDQRDTRDPKIRV